MKLQSSVSTALLSVIVFLLAYPLTAQSQDDSHSNHQQHQDSKQENLQDQIREMQSKIAQLEAALKQGHATDSSSSANHNTQTNMRGMKKMKGIGMSEMGGSDSKSMGGMSKGGMKGMGGKGGMGMMKIGGMSGGMDMGGMSGGGMGNMSGAMTGMQGMGMSRGMMMMGKMKNMGSMNTPSSLPGFPGASHIYHIGADGFFLNHDEHISLTESQQQSLNKLKEATLLSQAELDRKIESAEQQLWVLTSSDRPDAEKIEGKIEEIAKLQSKQRMEFIQAVGMAAQELTDEQRSELTGARNDDGAK